jgi:molecular chaperone Hsp33
MKSSDHLIIATAYGDTVRIYAARTTDLVGEAARIHDSWPTATAALGRLLSLTVMMGAMYDGLHRLTVELCSDGPAGRLLAVSNQRGAVKGEIGNPHTDLPLSRSGKLDVAGVIGTGYLSVIKDLGLKKPYQGIVPLQNSEIAEDFAYYFTKSEQTPSAVASGVLVSPDGAVKTAGGLIVQLMPGAVETQAAELEAKIAALPSLTTLFSSGKTPQWIAGEVGGPDVKILERLPLAYHCDCSWERFRVPLITLGPEELKELLCTEPQIEVQCHFCNKFYYYKEEDLNTEV